MRSATPSGSTRIRQQMYCPVDHAVVERGALVKGYEVAKDQYVPVTEEELQALEGAASTVIDIREFVPLPRRSGRQLKIVEPVRMNASPFAQDAADPVSSICPHSHHKSPATLAQSSDRFTHHLMTVSARGRTLIPDARAGRAARCSARPAPTPSPRRSERHSSPGTSQWSIPQGSAHKLSDLRPRRWPDG